MMSKEQFLVIFYVKSTHNRRECPVYGHRGGSRGRFYYRITTFEGRPWDARDPHKTTFMTLKHAIRLSIWRKQKETPGVEKADKSGFLGSIDTFGTNGKNWWVDRCIAIGNAGANYKFLGKYQIETIEATNLTKCYELSSATGTSNVSEATIAKGTLLAAEEQQKYDVSFYRDVLTFNGNEGG